MDRLGYGDTRQDGGTVSTGDDVEQFAALLRRLKDRTDRSYGSLARRLNMNTSTLHRYCAGEAVPQDYAPVERMAAFCGAPPEERLELHRLWLLALTARQRPKPDERVQEPATTDEPSEPTHIDAAAAQASTDEELKPTHIDAAAAQAMANGPSQPTSSGEAAEPATAGPSLKPTAAGPSSGPGGRTAAAADNADNAGGPEPTVPRDAGRPTGRPWYRRRRTVAGAAAAAVLLVTLGSLAALPAERPHGGAAKAPGRSRTAAAGASHHPSAAATNGPSPSRSSASASPSVGVRAPGSTGPKGGPSAGGRSDAPAPTGVPLAWSADSQVWQGGCGHDYVIRKEPAQVPPPPVQQDAGRWAATQGAVHGHQTMVQVSVQGKSSTAVVLTALRVRVVSRGTPVAGTAYDMEQGCGGDLTPRDFSVNLDVDRPIAHARPGNDAGKPLPAVRFPYRVSAEDPEVLLVTATTEAYDCAWYLELDWSSQGRSGTVRVDDHGRPFRTSSIKGLPRYWYGTNGQGVRQWVPADA
ncbi:helix-turn-helix domain-containing protein [Streptomyces sp. IBSBF 3136]|uniref:helix-turn-helix domain-containing protein n=1 Tax=Streptomyces sp. IBSBF 3136 TaxID=2903524 RepID=UPI002FDC3E27